MRKLLLVVGILLVVIGLVLCLLWYPILDVDSADDASSRVSGTVIATGIPLKFKGKISSLDEIFGLHVLYVSGFHDSFGDVPIVYNESASVSPGDEVVVTGKYANWLGIIRGVSGGSEDSQVLPADVQKVPLPLFYVGVVVLIAGGGALLFGSRP